MAAQKMRLSHIEKGKSLEIEKRFGKGKAPTLDLLKPQHQEKQDNTRGFVKVPIAKKARFFKAARSGKGSKDANMRGKTYVAKSRKSQLAFFKRGVIFVFLWLRFRCLKKKAYFCRSFKKPLLFSDKFGACFASPKIKRLRIWES
jgi:hypothetical protein